MGVNNKNFSTLVNAGADILVAGSAIFNSGKKMYSKNIKKLRNSWKRSDIKKIFKKILLKTLVYDFYLSKNDLSEILIYSL